jgi:hypothetical protein
MGDRLHFLNPATDFRGDSSPVGVGYSGIQRRMVGICRENRDNLGFWTPTLSIISWSIGRHSAIPSAEEVTS